MPESLGDVAHKQSGRGAFGLFLLIVFASTVGAGVFAFAEFTHTRPLSPQFIEQASPTLAWHETPRGLGLEPITLALTAHDADSGLDEVIVRISQNNQPRELLRKTIGDSTVRDETIEVTINPKELGLREGNAELQVSAFDKSIWSNSARLSTIVEVNFAKPQIAALTPQQNGVLGGTELVFYRVTGKPPESHGVLSQGTVYLGYPASGWDERFKDKSGLYVAFFPMPQTFNSSTDSMQLIARDSIGNSATGNFNYRVKQRRWSSFRHVLSNESAAQMRERLTSYAQREKLSVKLTGEAVADLKALIKTVAFSDEGFVDVTLSQPEPTRLWRDAFLPPVPSSPNNSVGDQRSVFLGSQEILRGSAAGVQFPVSKRTKIVAGNTGRVAFIGELGVLGNTIIIDHGMGLSTIYGHLSDVRAQRGALVQRGQDIGATGASGFAHSEEVYFEVRLHGVPVSPNEWWDQTWVTDHIDNKVAFVVRDAR